jgi:hypothetical protein
MSIGWPRISSTLWNTKATREDTVFHVVYSIGNWLKNRGIVVRFRTRWKLYQTTNRHARVANFLLTVDAIDAKMRLCI